MYVNSLWAVVYKENGKIYVPYGKAQNAYTSKGRAISQLKQRAGDNWAQRYEVIELTPKKEGE